MKTVPISRIFKNEDFGYRTITVDRPEGDGFVTAWPTGSTQPEASVVNYRTGQIVANSQLLLIQTLAGQRDDHDTSSVQRQTSQQVCIRAQT